MSIKSKFYKLPKKEFAVYLDNLKSSPETKFFLTSTTKPYFYHPDSVINSLFLELNKAQWEFDRIMDSFSKFAKQQIIISFLLDEIESTNKIENIYSTRHDIFSVINQGKNNKDKKIVSIVNSYQLLLKSHVQIISNLIDIRKIYDNLLKGAIDKDDIPDGEFFRKGSVKITNEIRIIHQGLSGENNINVAMNEFLNLYNSDIEIFEKMILCHFIIETIHPYYDGNGRLGRFLFSNGLFLKTKSLSAFLIAKSFSNEKSKYYEAFKKANDIHEFGSLNEFVKSIAKILINQINIASKDLLIKKQKIENMSKPLGLTKSEKII